MKDCVVIGGGPSGLAAASKIAEKGYDVALIERKKELGGLLDQCIHDGFGTKLLDNALSGPEFASIFINKVKAQNIPVYTENFVKSVLLKRNHKEIICISPQGVERIKTRSIVYAIGCRERNHFELRITGDRPAGVYTAGTVQRLVNLYGILPGEKALIVGGGDVGMIVARHLYLEGMKDILIVFPEEFFVGLPRNVQQCVLDFNIPYKPRTIVKHISGKKRVKKVTLTRVDANWDPIPNTTSSYACDTIIIAAGLIPYSKKLQEIGAKIDPVTQSPRVNEFFETSVTGVFGVGNLVQIFDYVDDAVESAHIAAEGVDLFLSNANKREKPIPLECGENIQTTTPNKVEWETSGKITLFFRTTVSSKHAKIQLKNERGTLLKQYVKPYVTPSALERVEVPKPILQDTSKVILSVKTDA